MSEKGGLSLDQIEGKLNVRKQQGLSEIIENTALDLEQVFLDDKNLMISEKNKNLDKIKRIVKKLKKLPDEAKNKIESLNTDITDLEKLKGLKGGTSESAVKEILTIKKQQKALLEITGGTQTNINNGSNNRKTRIEEYKSFLDKAENFTDTKINRININTQESLNTITPDSYNLDKIFLTDQNKKLKEYILCDNSGKKLEYNKDKKEYTIQLSKKGGGTEEVKITGVNFKIDPPIFSEIFKNIKFTPDKGLDFKESIKLSITGVYKNVGPTSGEGTDVNIAHNKKFLLDIDDGTAKKLNEKGITDEFNNYNKNNIIQKDIENFYIHHYKNIETGFIKEIINDKDNENEILKDIYKSKIIDGEIITQKQTNPTLEKEFTDLIIEKLTNGDKKHIMGGQNMFEYIKTEKDNLLKEFFKDKIKIKLNNKLNKKDINNNDIKDNDGKAIKDLSIAQKILQRAENIHDNYTKNTEILDKSKINDKLDSDITDVFVGNVNKVFIDDLTKKEAYNSKRGKYIIESKSGYERRMKQRAKKRARKLIKSKRFILKGSNLDKAKIAVERTQYESTLLQQLDLDSKKILKIEDERTIAAVNIIAQKFIKENGANKEKTQRQFEDELAKPDILPKGANKKLIADNFIKTLESKIDEKDILTKITENKDNIGSHVSEIKNNIVEYQKKYNGELPVFFQKLPLDGKREHKFNPENKNFLNNLIKLADYEGKLNELKTNIENTKVNIHYVKEVQKANTIDNQVNNFLEKRMNKSGLEKLGVIAGATIISSGMASLMVAIGMIGVTTIAPTVAFSMLLAFFQKKGIHKETVNKIQNEYNNKGIEEREEYLDKMMQENNQLTPGQFSQSFRYEVKDLAEKLEKYTHDDTLDDEKAIELGKVVSTAVTLKYCQHKFGVTELGGHNEKEYHGLMRNTLLGIQKYKNYAISANESSRKKLKIPNDDKTLSQINAKYFLDQREQLQDDISNTASSTNSNIDAQATKRGIKDALVSGGLSGVLGYFLSGISYGFSGNEIATESVKETTKTITEKTSGTIFKNLRTPLDLVKPVRDGIKGVLEFGTSAPGTAGSVVLPVIPIDTDNRTKQKRQERSDKIIETTQKITKPFRKKEKK